jgi:hypothetical protein
MTREPGSLKAQAAVQDNGPDYWIVTTGRWREPAAAICEREDDAVLFAAAPDLLAACEAALRRMADTYGETFSAACHMDHDPLVIALRAAIARATITPA